jgi:glycosyltransferase involved in cell wall biosynthesis
MKLLLIAPLPLPGGPVGGIGSVTENMVQFLKKNPDGIDLVLHNTIHRIRSITSNSLFIRLFTGILNSLKTYFQVIVMIHKNRPDIIHLASSSSFALLKDHLIVKAAYRAKIPIVMHWHFGRIPSLSIKQNWEWKAFIRICRKSTISVVIDKKTYDTLHKTGISNVVYVPNALSADVEQKARELLGKPDQRQPNRLVYVGHVIKNKGVYELVEACSQIPVINDLILIGSYDEKIKNELLKIAYKKDEGKWIKFMGQQTKNEVLGYMFNSPILVLPSYTEGFPMVIIEAMVMGCAIIATDVGAIPDILAINSDKPCGLCIPPQNIEKLKEAVVMLVNDPNLIDLMGKRGLERALGQYNLEHIMNQYKKIWKTAASKSSAV